MENQEKKSSSFGSILIIGGLSFWVWWLLQRKPKVCEVCLKNECEKCPECIQNIQFKESKTTNNIEKICRKNN